MEENSSIGFWKIAVAVLTAAILIGIVFLIARQGKAVVNEKLEVISNAISENQYDGYLIYENVKVSGDEVLEVIKKVVDKKECISVRVVTGMNQSNKNLKGTDYNFTLEETEDWVMISRIDIPVNQPIPNEKGQITDENYINPSGRFRCEIKRDANGTLVALVFTQVL